MTVALKAAGEWRRLVPRSARHQVHTWLSSRKGRLVLRQLCEVSRNGRSVVIGPWLGEVGFELLYWVPFLRWAMDVSGLEPQRVVVVSRGGTASWYQGLAARYADVFDYLSPADFDARNRMRASEVGEQKQLRTTALEHDLVAMVTQALHLDRPDVLHPSLMFDVMSPYWWGHRAIDWVDAHARYAPLVIDPPSASEGLPSGYAAVKFYFNECFPPTAANRETATSVVRRLAEDGPVVSLATGLRVDDHAAWAEEEQLALYGIRARLTPSTNLALQTTVVAGASRWAGTYGGFAYLAPFCRVPASAYFSHPSGFSSRHLELALRVFGRFGHNLLQLN